jgi:hypothetical protein
MNTEAKQTFDAWCLVELFGHAKIAGRCTEQNIAGTNFLRVDVPETDRQPSFTKFFGAGAIYAINPIDEASAKLFAKEINTGPITLWQGESFTKKYNEAKAQLPASTSNEDNDDDFGLEG